MPAKRSKKRWVAKVTTDSTHPPRGLFTKKASAIARSLASNRVSPKGPGSGMRMLTYFINRGGRGLSASRRAELQRAKRLLSKRIDHQRAAQAESRRHSPRFLAALLRWQRPEEILSRRVSRQEECRACLLRFCLHRRLNQGNEGLSGESLAPGGRRHPSFGCEHG